MKKLFLLSGILLMFTSCDITDYFMDEFGVVKHKDGTVVSQSEINGNVEASEAQQAYNPKVAKLSDIVGN